MQNTLKNLATAFIGESQARNRYTIYAKIAKKEGYEQMSEIFMQTAEQELEHAKWLMRLINELEEKIGIKQEIKVNAEVPANIGKTAENLKAAIDGEHYEHSEMYPNFTAEAEAEGLPEIASRLKAIARAEAHHEERYKKLLSQLETGSVFKKDSETAWVCRKCGYEYSGPEAPPKCPACGHPQSYYQVKCENY
ncbi:rubrerythrin family protein [Candidatus Falkowbacteria bacterium]|nr:MAG: rubrerythrin family protein [Candidatus Falkowbacteria bacterium]